MTHFGFITRRAGVRVSEGATLAFLSRMFHDAPSKLPQQFRPTTARSAAIPRQETGGARASGGFGQVVVAHVPKMQDGATHENAPEASQVER